MSWQPLLCRARRKKERKRRNHFLRSKVQNATFATSNTFFPYEKKKNVKLKESNLLWTTLHPYRLFWNHLRQYCTCGKHFSIIESKHLTKNSFYRLQFTMYWFSSCISSSFSTNFWKKKFVYITLEKYFWKCICQNFLDQNCWNGFRHSKAALQNFLITQIFYGRKDACSLVSSVYTKAKRYSDHLALSNICTNFCTKSFWGPTKCQKGKTTEWEAYCTII